MIITNNDIDINIVDDFLKENYFILCGSAVFTKRNSLISKLVSMLSRQDCADNEFVPSHIGSVYEKDGELWILNIKPPRAKAEKLSDWLKNTDCEYRIVTRDFVLDTDIFSDFIDQFNGMRYGLISAIQSIFKYITFKFGYHCSEVHLMALQLQGLFKYKNANKITPDGLMHLLTNYKGV